MDGLNNDERALAWLAGWHPSFDGKAIINPDFTFRSVNTQFCKILDVSPAELLDNKFTDLTPEPSRTLDVKNATWVKQGRITSYLIDKVYEFPSGRRVDVTLLVKGVYSKSGEFLFFVSSIMGRETIKLPAEYQPPKPTGFLPQWVDKKTAIMTVITAVGFWVAYFLEKIFK